jgi:hypothetical protein
MSTNPMLEEAKEEALRIMEEHAGLLYRAVNLKNNAAVRDLITLGWIAGALHTCRSVKDIARTIKEQAL